jgi:hypothetical protein
MPAESNEMTNKIAFINLDGVVANGDARFAMAEEVASSNFPRQSKDWTNAYWHNVFMPDRVSLDTLIPGVHEAMERISNENYGMLYLTSRPEHMREATLAWLKQHGLFGLLNELFMKPASMQYIKTVVWKCGLIHTLAFAYSATEVLVVDDEQMNLDELQKYTTSFAMKFYKSLDMQEPTDDDIKDAF